MNLLFIVNVNCFLHSDLFESLAWASAQVHCQCTTNSKMVLSEKINTMARSMAINASTKSKEISWISFLLFIYYMYLHDFVTDTTFAPWQQDNGHVVLNTKPKILCCDLRLSPGESKTCKFLMILIKFLHLEIYYKYFY